MHSYPLILAIILHIYVAATKSSIYKEEVEALTALKQAMYNSTAILPDWTPKVSHCSWMGVECNDATGHVVRLELGSIGLNGSIPSQISKLSSLQVLDLSDNFLHGGLSLFLWELRSLKHLNLTLNRFNDSISPLISQLTQLEVLDLSRNFFFSRGIPFTVSSLSGGIPLTLWELRSLRHLNLNYNSLNGSISPLISKLTKLEVLDLSMNSLSGGIPLTLWELKSLKHLDLSSNKFNGSISSLISQLTELEVLDLSCNLFFSRGIPLTLWELRSLKHLDLNYNMFNGSISPLISQLTKLEVLDLSWNSLSGGIPLPLWELKSLTILNLGSNRLNGSIPPQISQLTHLQELDLSSNSFSVGSILLLVCEMKSIRRLHLSNISLTGPLPSNLGMMKNLVELDLSNNNLTGPLPSNLGMMQNLEILDLRNNMLTGEIPPEVGLLKNLSDLYLGSNRLHGTIPSTLGNCSSFFELRLDNNQLIGHIPTSITELPNIDLINLEKNRLTGHVNLHPNSSLQFLFLGSNLLTGSFPRLWPNLFVLDISNNLFSGQFPLATNDTIAQLEILSAANNQFIGSIPSWIWNLRCVYFLDLSHNQLRGRLPSSLNLTLWSYLWFIESDSTIDIINVKGREMAYRSLPSDMGFLDLSENELFGELPEAIGSQILGLRFLNLSHNKLSGQLPPSLDNLTILESLDLSYNQFSGIIPTALSKLTFLAYFNVSFNKLQGPVPKGGQIDTFDLDSYLGNPELCGAMLPHKCLSTVNGTSSSRLEAVVHYGMLQRIEEFMSLPAFALAAVTSFSLMLWIIAFWDKPWEIIFGVRRKRLSRTMYSM